MNLNSPEFLTLVKERNHTAIEYLFKQYHESLIRGALKQNLSFDQAETAVTDTWFTFFDNVENFEGRSHIRTYLFGILYNKIKEVWRSNKKYTSQFDEKHFDEMFEKDGHYKIDVTDPADWAETKETFNIIQNAIEQLPENQRIAFTLKEIEGFSSEEICNILGITNTNLGVLIYRAKNNLRVILEANFKEEDKK